MVMRHDPLADAMSTILNAERVGKKECKITPVSGVIRGCIEILKKEGYIEDYEYKPHDKGGEIVVRLSGRINMVKAIKPRMFVKKDEYRTFEKRFLPAVGVGTLIVSTSQGIKSHREIDGKIGGQLLAFVY